jgi:uncharacterized repeat protein (TIGR01451 family)
MFETLLFRARRPALSFGLLALAWPLLFLPAALADEAATPRVNVTIQVEREVTEPDPAGRPVIHREPVETAGPGDVLVYTLQAKNVGASPAFNARLQDEIPRGTVLVTESVPPGSTRVMASLDGGSTWQDFPALIERRLEDGTTAQAPAAADSYTHLRWVLAGRLDPGDQREVSFKVRIQ